MYDLIIVGGGPAGLAAALYAARYDLKTLLICVASGGAMENAYEIENYPGFEKISGAELASKIIAQINKLGVPGEEELLGRGVSYCPTCDGRFFKDRIVAVIGGGDAGLASANLLADI